jgi:hypothetical protein
MQPIISTDLSEEAARNDAPGGIDDQRRLCCIQDRSAEQEQIVVPEEIDEQRPSSYIQVQNAGAVKIDDPAKTGGKPHRLDSFFVITTG